MEFARIKGESGEAFLGTPICGVIALQDWHAWSVQIGNWVHCEAVHMAEYVDLNTSHNAEVCVVVGDETSVIEYLSLAVASELKLCQLCHASVQ